MISQLLTLPMWQNVAGLAKLDVQREVPWIQEVQRARPMGIEASLCDAGSRDVGMLPMIEIMGWRLH